MFGRKLSHETFGAPHGASFSCASASGSYAADPAISPHALSAADPEALARVVRSHKLGDVIAQALLTLALLIAIGAVMLVLGVDRAAAAGLAAVHGSLDAVGVLPLAVLGAILMVFALRPLKLRPVRVRRAPSSRS